jgi:regulatory protein
MTADTVLITDIRTTKKGLYALFSGEEFLFSVDRAAISDHSIRCGEIDGRELEAARGESDFRRACSKALDLLALRDHSEAELRRKLERHFGGEAAREAAGRMKEWGYLDDADYAARYAAGLAGRKNASLREIECRLRGKGLREDDIAEAAGGLAESERERIRALIGGKYLSRLRGPNGPASVFGALMRRGFSARDIRAEMSEFEIEMPEPD